MSTITFDTLKFVKKLESPGLPAPQAEAIAEAFKDVGSEAELAMKQYVKESEMALRVHISEIKCNLIYALRGGNCPDWIDPSQDAMQGANCAAWLFSRKQFVTRKLRTLGAIQPDNFSRARHIFFFCLDRQIEFNHCYRNTSRFRILNMRG